MILIIPAYWPVIRCAGMFGIDCIARNGSKVPSLELAAYEAAWPRMFDELSEGIRRALGGEFETAEHIGSTSVVGMLAKPVIDILVGVRRVPLSNEATHYLTQLGYEACGAFGLPYRAYFRKAGVHVHCYVPHTGQWDSHLLFRDYLRASAVARSTYVGHKQRLAREGSADLEYYVAHKEEVVSQLLIAAVRWHEAGRPTD
jgi:GrpB-like predicted nucleotidyltransferase (UPF0157 family)